MHFGITVHTHHKGSDEPQDHNDSKTIIGETPARTPKLRDHSAMMDLGVQTLQTVETIALMI